MCLFTHSRVPIALKVGDQLLLAIDALRSFGYILPATINRRLHHITYHLLPRRQINQRLSLNGNECNQEYATWTPAYDSGPAEHAAWNAGSIGRRGPESRELTGSFVESCQSRCLLGRGKKRCCGQRQGHHAEYLATLFHLEVVTLEDYCRQKAIPSTTVPVANTVPVNTLAAIAGAPKIRHPNAARLPSTDSPTNSACRYNVRTRIGSFAISARGFELV